MDMQDVKKTMINQTKVMYDGAPYLISACIMRIHKGRWYYQLELKDLKARSCLVIADMVKVEVLS